ncbi:MAG: TetR/AcrR family transcriptional regulator [Fulvivirga sp.]
MRQRDPNKEEKIKQIALQMIVEEGFDRLSMQKLAKAANVSPATIYIYFKDREDLILQIGIEEERKMFEATLLNFDPEMSFEEGLRVQWINRANYFLKNPNQMHFMEQLKYSRFSKEINAQVKSYFVEKMTRFAQKAIDNRELVPLPVEVYWSLAFAPLYQLVKFHVTKKSMHNKPFELDEPTLQHTLSIVLKGLKP